MNHAGEIAPLSRLVRPHVAVITTVEPVHLEFFPSVEAIADAKAEIFEGLEPDGVAVLNRDNRHFDRLAEPGTRPRRRAAFIGFGAMPKAECAPGRLPPRRGRTARSRPTSSASAFRYRLTAPGRHWVLNSLAVLAAVKALGADAAKAAAAAWLSCQPLKGRGQRVHDRRGARHVRADRRELQRQPGRDARRLRGAGARHARARAAGASPCSATCASSARRGRRLHADLARDLRRPVSISCSPAGPHMARLVHALAAADGRAACTRPDFRTRSSPVVLDADQAGRRGAGQGLARQPHGADRRGPARARRPGAAARRQRELRAPMLFNLLTPLAEEVRGLQPVPLPHLPQRRRGPDRARHQLRDRPAVHPLAEDEAARGPADPPGRAGKPPLTKKGTPTMGGVLILLALGVSTLLWADLRNGYVWVGAVGHRRLRRDRLRRRLPEAHASATARACRAALKFLAQCSSDRCSPASPSRSSR